MYGIVILVCQVTMVTQEMVTVNLVSVTNMGAPAMSVIQELDNVCASKNTWAEPVDSVKV